MKCLYVYMHIYLNGTILIIKKKNRLIIPSKMYKKFFLFTLNQESFCAMRNIGSNPEILERTFFQRNIRNF